MRDPTKVERIFTQWGRNYRCGDSTMDDYSLFSCSARGSTWRSERSEAKWSETQRKVEKMCRAATKCLHRDAFLHSVYAASIDTFICAVGYRPVAQTETTWLTTRDYVGYDAMPTSDISQTNDTKVWNLFSERTETRACHINVTENNNNYHPLYSLKLLAQLSLMIHRVDTFLYRKEFTKEFPFVRHRANGSSRARAKAVRWRVWSRAVAPRYLAIINSSSLNHDRKTRLSCLPWSELFFLWPVA